MCREKINLNLNWKFTRDNLLNIEYRGLDDEDFEEITLPHDWSVREDFSKDYSSGTGYLANGQGAYRKHFKLKKEWKNKKVFITFEGVYNNSKVWCNSYYVDKRPYGYSTFTYDITDFVEFGEDDNVISVLVNHKESADSRWFTGSGIYRNVYITLKDNNYFAKDGVFVKSKAVSSESAIIEVDVDLINEISLSEECFIRCELVDDKGTSLVETKEEIEIEEGTIKRKLEMKLNNPKLWSPNNPYLYNLNVSLASKDKIYDNVKIKVGIRKIEFDSKKGFFLNGVNTKMKGVCLHHDAGCLGAGVPKEVWKNRLVKLKEMGCNAIRCSHNPPSPDFLDLCDQLGFLVQDEAFDEWEGVKNKWWQGHNVYPPKHYGYYEDFPQWHKRDLQGMVKRDRNHPSVVFWSIGNEIDYPNDPYCHPYFNEMTGNNDKNKPKAERMYDKNKPNATRLVTIAKRLVSLVKECDETREVTCALAFPELSNLTGLADVLDIVGYNYKEHLYAEAKEKWPDRVVYGSENSRDFDKWLSVESNDRICAQFIWTGIDYLGEARGWPTRIATSGFMDVGGFEKPSYYYRQSLWADRPMIKLTSKKDDDERFHWNYNKGDIIEVSCYSNCEEVELFLNNDSLGKKSISNQEKRYAKWNVEYKEGELKAITIDSKGEQHISKLITHANAKHISCELTKEILRANGEDVCEIEMFVKDQNGVLIEDERHNLTVTCEGPIALLGLENGDCDDLEPYYSNKRKTYNGHLKAYIRSKEIDGKGIIKISCDDSLYKTILIESIK